MKKLLILLITFSFLYTANAADYYWVGGSGSWSELTHWATTSGGSVFHPNVPDANDNVYFDANSFSAAGQVVSITSGSAYCRRLDFTGANAPIIQGTSKLMIYESLILIPEMTFDFKGEINLEGEKMPWE